MVCDDLHDLLQLESYTTRTDGRDGVAGDLVVRPFQWKGIASSLRHFVIDLARTPNSCCDERLQCYPDHRVIALLNEQCAEQACSNPHM